MGRRVYLDHAATTPMVAAAIEAVSAELTRVGNPSSLHRSGREARRVLEESREVIAARLGADPAEVIFTAGGTEADNLALLGGYRAARRRTGAARVIASAVEHHAVLETVQSLADSEGADLQWAPVDSAGRIDVDAVGAQLDAAATALVTVMWANNEVGTLQPVERIAALAREHGAVAHSDAVQALGHVRVDFAASGLDCLSVSAHKIGGPVGIGALVARRGLALSPVQHGGGQERDVRSGTLDVVGAAGFAAAIEVAVAGLEAEATRLRTLRAGVLSGVLGAVEDVTVNGTGTEEETLPGIANLSFAGCRADDLLLLLDAAGIDCSSGSACSAGVSQPSHVLEAMGRSSVEAGSALRISLGHDSTEADVAALVATLPSAVERARRAG
ncbi:MAG: cysteine desulfurase family protein [Propionibacteriaceae bacterium]